VLGYRPFISPPPASTPSDMPAVEWTLEAREQQLREARDALAAAKVRQAEQANRKRGKEPPFEKGQRVMVDSSDRRSRFKSKSQDARAAKLFARWDGPYTVEEASPETSTYRLALPASDRAHPVFHASKLKAYVENDPLAYAAREPPRPDPIDVDGEKEWTVEAILDEKGRGKNRKFLVKWLGWPDDQSAWESLSTVEDLEAMDEWEEKKRRGDV
jgi:hypothetical protein